MLAVCAILVGQASLAHSAEPSLVEPSSVGSSLVESGPTKSDSFAWVPLNSSILLFDRRSFEQGPSQVRRIAELGDRRLMLVVTMQCRLSSQLRPFELGLMTDRTKSWKSLRNFEPLDDELLEEYRSLLAAILAEADKHGMQISLMLHLDPAGAVEEWRNFYDFDPLKPVGAHSYETALIDSCLEAIEQSVARDTPIQFSLAGEMGRSVFAHPNSYRQLVDKVRQRLAGRPVQVGISFNHNDLTGGAVSNASQRADTQRLFAELDFVGFSHYRPFALPPTTEHFRGACQGFIDALAKLDIQLPEQTPLHFSEIALGGAPNERGVAFAEWAAKEPWEGTNLRDHSPWRTEPMVMMRRDYHTALLKFLSEPMGQHPVRAVYLWSEGSWDPQGIASPDFSDSVIQKQIRKHNLRAQASGALPVKN